MEQSGEAKRIAAGAKHAAAAKKRAATIAAKKAEVSEKRTRGSLVIELLKGGNAASSILRNKDSLFECSGAFAFGFRPLFHFSERLIERSYNSAI